MPREVKGVAGDPSLLQAALEGLELQRTRIDEQIAQVRAMLGQKRRGRPPASVIGTESPGHKPERKKRVLSAAARKRIAAAQKKRWANFRKSEESKQG